MLRINSYEAIKYHRKNWWHDKFLALIDDVSWKKPF
jgi:hypothetical protein